MGFTETHFWLGLGVISGLVLIMLTIGPAAKAYSKWRLKRAFRARLEGYGPRRREARSRSGSDKTDCKA